MKSELTSNETPPMSPDDIAKIAEENTDESGLILGKFKSQEDLISSYKELENKLTAKDSETEETVEEETKEPVDDAGDWDQFYNEDGSVDFGKSKEVYGDKLGELFEENNVDPFAISKHFHENNGKITDEMYEQLESTGLPRTLIDAYLDGRAVQSNYTTETTTDPNDPYEEIVGIAGGETQYKEMLQWMDGSLSNEEKQNYDKIVDGKDSSVTQISLAVQNMYNKYRSNKGIEPQLMSGKSSSTPSLKTFKSNAEVVAAMRDPRYKNDIAYQHEVQRKLAQSDVFSISG
tara:strand:+ start:3809 stop:4678 length:870 start_codon:yes stop_codon:yes gene_type:complete